MLLVDLNHFANLLGPRRGLKRRRAKDSSIEEESSDADINQPSTSTASNTSKFF